VALLIGMGALGNRIRLRHSRGPLPRGRRRVHPDDPDAAVRCSSSAGLLDAVTMIGVGIALYLLFANPFNRGSPAGSRRLNLEH